MTVSTKGTRDACTAREGGRLQGAVKGRRSRAPTRDKVTPAHFWGVV